MEGKKVVIGYVKKGSKGSSDYIFKLSDGRIGLIDKAVEAEVYVEEGEVWLVTVVVSKESYAIVRPVREVKYEDFVPVPIIDIPVIEKSDETVKIKIADKEFVVNKKQ